MRSRLIKSEKVNLSHLKAFQELPIRGRSKEQIAKRLEIRLGKEVRKMFYTISVESELLDRVESRLIKDLTPS